MAKTHKPRHHHVMHPMHHMENAFGINVERAQKSVGSVIRIGKKPRRPML